MLQDIVAVYPLTPLQEGILLQTQLGDAEVYLTQFSFSFNQEVDEAAFKQAWQAIVSRHDVFRTAFSWEDDEPLQLVLATATLDIEVLDWSEKKENERGNLWAQLTELDSQQTFNLQQAPLLRVKLIKESTTCFKVLWTVHHIVLDGWSRMVVLKEFFNLYESYAHGCTVNLTDPRNFSDYLDWLSEQDKEASASYWQNVLNGAKPTQLNQPTSTAAEAIVKKQYQLQQGLNDQLKSFLSKQQITLNSFFQVFWSISLARFSKQTDIVFATVVSMRPADIESIENRVGLFINTLPVRIDLRDGDETLSSVFARVKQNAAELLEHAYLPLAELGQYAEVNTTSELCTTHLVVENYPLDEALAKLVNNNVISDIKHQVRTSAKLTLSVLSQLDSICCNFLFQQSVYSEEFIAQLWECLNSTIQAVLKNPNLTLRKLMGHPVVAVSLPQTSIDKTIAQANNQLEPIIEKIKTIWSDLLAAKTIKEDDSFFNIGGNSLLAIRMIARINKAFTIKLPFKDFFKQPQLNQLAKLIAKQTGCLNEVPDIATQEPAFPLSLEQQNLWFAEKLSQQNSAYNISTLLKITGQLDVRAYQTAFEKLLSKHTLLRANFFEQDGKALQKYRSDNKITFQYINQEASILEHEAKQIILERLIKPFDLAAEPLIKVVLIQFAENTFLCGIALHHLIADGWSIQIILNDLKSFYESPELNIPEEKQRTYKSYIARQENKINSDEFAEALSYWKHELANAPALLSLPFDHARNMTTAEGKRYSFEFAKPLSLQVKAFANQHGMTTHMLLLSVFSLLLYKVSRQKDFCIGTPVSNRLDADYEKTVGLFVNTLALRQRIQVEVNVADYLEQSVETILEGISHQELPFGYLVEQLQPERVVGVSPLFQVMFLMQESHLKNFSLAKLAVEQLGYDPEVAKFDLTLMIKEEESNFAARFEYNAALFNEATIQTFAKFYQDLLERLINNPSQSIAKLISDRSSLKLEIAQESYQQSIVPRLFQSFSKHADKIALLHDGQSLTYQQLANKIDALVAGFKSFGLQQGDIFALNFSRSVELVVTILACLKLGLTYCPLDQSWPQQRIKNILQELQPRRVIDSALYSSLLNNPGDSALAKFEKQEYAADSLVYIIYTSGSTGQPKGVMISQANLYYSLVTRLQYYQHGPKQFLLLSSLAFDSSVAGFFSTFLTGGTLVLPKDEEVADPESLVRYFSKGVTHTLCVPSLYNHLLDFLISDSALEVLILAGETLPKELLERHLQKLPQVAVYNEYGPTEDTVWATVKKIESSTSKISIGKPIQGTTVMLVDKDCLPVSAGMAGEICLAGPGISSGYFKQPQLSADAFFAYQDLRFYRTRDLAKWNDDGELIFLGRTDEQIKVNGYRIESGEVISAILNFTGVKEAALVQCDTRLVACLILEAGSSLREPELMCFLQNYLPAYMLPTQFLLLEKMPLTYNAKLDKNKLQEIATQSFAARKMVALKTETEKLTAAIWQELFAKDSISRNDNFFALGGHSLLAAKLINRVNEHFSIELKLSDIFLKPVLKDFAHLIETANEGFTTKKNEEQTIAKDFPVSDSQKSLWLASKLSAEPTKYHITSALKVDGQVEVERLQKALQRLQQRHQLLRATLNTTNDEPTWRVNDAVPLPFSFEEIQANENEIISIIKQFEKESFNFAAQLLWRFKLIQVDANTSYLVTVFHHLIFDAWSLEIFSRELALFYKEPGAQLEAVVDFSNCVSIKESNASNSIDEWRNYLSESNFVLELPTDYPRPARLLGKGESYISLLPDALSIKLIAYAEQQQVTLFNLFFSAFSLLLAKMSKQADFIVGIPSANRKNTAAENCIGLFIDTLPIKVAINEKHTLAGLLQQTKLNFFAALDISQLPFDKLVNELLPERDLSRSPLFQVLFSLQPNVAVTNFAGLSAETVNYQAVYAKYDLALNVLQGDKNNLTIRWNFNTELFASETIKNFNTALLAIFESMVTLPSKVLLSSADFLNNKLRQQLLNDFNNTDCSLAIKSLPELFAETVQQFPQATAVKFSDECLSYSELDARSNQLANCLVELSISPRQVIAVEMARCLMLPVVLLAILKMGCAYLPIDPRLPKDRKHKMQAIAQARLLITDEFITSNNNKIAASNSTALQRVIALNDLAYVIFTSGSTGEPKGVMVSHAAIANRLLWMQQQFPIDTTDNVLQKTTISFDVSVWELFWPLITGASLVLLPPDKQADSRFLVDFVNKEEISVMHFVPSMLRAFLATSSVSTTDSLSYIFASGEALAADLVEQCLTKIPTAKFYNLYGPTEAAIDVTFWDCSQLEPKKQRAAIGKPIANMKIYVLDENLMLVPVGAVGQLYLSGIGLANGYINQPELTKDRFIINPYARNEFDKNLYQTGDLAKYDAEGNLYFLGRVDRQIKLRGYRIELSEIEACVLKYSNAIRQAVACVDHEKLSVFFRVDNEAATEGLLSFIQARLPSYMIPESFVMVDSIPLSNSGKIDYQALLLSKPKETTSASNANSTTAIEKVICEMLESLLDKNEIAVDSDFFSAGGNSLTVTRLAVKLEQVFSVDLPLETIFNFRTPRKLAEQLLIEADSVVLEKCAKDYLTSLVVS